MCVKNLGQRAEQEPRELAQLRSGRRTWVAAAVLASVAVTSACGGSGDKGTGPPSKSKSSTTAAQSSSAPATSSASPPETSVTASGLAKRLLQQADVGNVKMQAMNPAAVAQRVQQIAGAPSPNPSNSNKPACTKAMNTGISTSPIDPTTIAGEVIGDASSALINVVGPKAVFVRGIAASRKGIKACTGATVTQKVNGVNTVSKPTFSTRPNGFVVVTTTVTGTGKSTVYSIDAIGVAGSYGVELLANSAKPIPVAAFNTYLAKAISRAKG